MRIHLHTTPNQEIVPFDYQQRLSGVFYTWLGDKRHPSVPSGQSCRKRHRRTELQRIYSGRHPVGQCRQGHQDHLLRPDGKQQEMRQGRHPFGHYLPETRTPGILCHQGHHQDAALQYPGKGCPPPDAGRHHHQGKPSDVQGDIRRMTPEIRRL